MLITIGARLVRPYGTAETALPQGGRIEYRPETHGVWEGALRGRETVTAKIVDGIAEQVELTPGVWKVRVIPDHGTAWESWLIELEPGMPEPVDLVDLAPVLVVDGEKWAVGPTGPAGPQGEAGPAGPAGADGADGADGTNGVDGADGAAGPQGEPGADSTIPGPTGPQGEIGPAGADGIQGIQGIPGVAGADGTNGIDGAQGIQGEPGPKGDKGDPGLTPTEVETIVLNNALLAEGESVTSLTVEQVDGKTLLVQHTSTGREVSVEIPVVVSGGGTSAASSVEAVWDMPWQAFRTQCGGGFLSRTGPVVTLFIRVPRVFDGAPFIKPAEGFRPAKSRNRDALLDSYAVGPNREVIGGAGYFYDGEVMASVPEGGIPEGQTTVKWDSLTVRWITTDTAPTGAQTTDADDTKPLQVWPVVSG